MSAKTLFNPIQEEEKALEEENIEKAIESLRIPESKPMMCPNTVEMEIRDRLPNLTEEEVKEVAALIDEYR